MPMIDLSYNTWLYTHVYMPNIELHQTCAHMLSTTHTTCQNVNHEICIIINYYKKIQTSPRTPSIKSNCIVRAFQPKYKPRHIKTHTNALPIAIVFIISPFAKINAFSHPGNKVPTPPLGSSLSRPQGCAGQSLSFK